MKIHIGTDHAGFHLKNMLKDHLASLGHEVVDHGAFELNEKDDYPDFIGPTAEAVAADPESRGIILGGSGQGEAMDANRVEGVRAIEFYGGNMDIVRLGREHNDANILSLGARFVSEEEAKQAVDLFLGIKFSGDDRHVRRIKKMDN